MRQVDFDNPFSTETAAFWSYVGTVFVLAFAGVGGGRILLALSLLLLGTHLVRQRRRPCMPRVGWLALAYIVWISLAVLWGPGGRIEPLYKHLPWLQIPIAAMLVNTPKRLLQACKAYAAGCGVLALRVLSSATNTVFQSCREGVGIDAENWFARIFLHQHLDGTDLIGRLVDQGGMQDGQRLAVGLIAIAAVAMLAPRPSKRYWTLLWFLVLVALGLTFKRGAWMALGLVSVGVALHALFKTTIAHRFGPRQLRLLGVGVLLVVVLGASGLGVTGRMGQWHLAATERLESMSAAGGRICMWVTLTPELVRRHPWGIGFKTLDSERMQSLAPQVEAGHNHVHSNLLQSLVDGGWVGLLLFCAWMFSAFATALKHSGGVHWFRASVPDAGWEALDRRMGTAFGLMLLSLFIIGLFEYQIGTGQIVLLYGMLMGCAAAGAERQDQRCRAGLTVSSGEGSAIY